MPDGQTNDPLAEIREEMGAAFRKLRQSPSFRALITVANSPLGQAIREAAQARQEQEERDETMNYLDSVYEQFMDVLVDLQPNLEPSDEGLNALARVLTSVYSRWVTYGVDHIEMIGDERVYAIKTTSGPADVDQLARIIANVLKEERVDAFPELSHILHNASYSASRLYDAINSQDRSQMPDRSTKRQHATALRDAVTLRDSLNQAAKLMAGEDLEEPEEREFFDLREPFEEMPQSGQQIRSAYAYAVMKRLKCELEENSAMIVVPADTAYGDSARRWVDQLEDAMQVIIGHKDVPGNTDDTKE